MEAKKSKFTFYIPEFDEKRLAEEPSSPELEPEDYRTNFRRDYGRLIHSPCLRRLTGKTQLYPGKESDFFRNRLSHSLEVSQVAKSIAIKLNSTEKFPDNNQFDLNTDLIEFAALAHDIGHPPFGHQGEEALDQCMLEHGGFEGNAQTLRILCKLEKKLLTDPSNSPLGISPQGEDLRLGLNLSYRTLASILKYSKVIPPVYDRLNEKDLKKGEEYKLHAYKGYYLTEQNIVDRIIFHVLEGKKLPQDLKFKTIECSIMDLADDIAYSTYDLEDGLKGGFFNPLDMIFSNLKVLSKVSEEVSERLNRKVEVNDIRDIFISIFDRWLFGGDYTSSKSKDSFQFLKDAYQASKDISRNGYIRTGLSSFLVGKFIRGVKVQFNDKFPQLSQAYFDDDTKLMVEVLKTYNYESMIVSPRLRVAEFRGKEIVKTIFETLNDKNGKGVQLMPKDVQQLYYTIKDSDKPRIICDYIAGMTDRYCIEFYGRLKSENPETIFKPF